jgi:hypothetical protein
MRFHNRAFSLSASCSEREVMTCILVAHLGDEVIIAADKRVTEINQDGVKIPCGDNEEKIVRTNVGVITGAGSLAMLDPVKSFVRDHGFKSPDDVLDLILRTRDSFSKFYAESPRLQADLAETSWMFTYPTVVDDQSVTRFAYYHQQHGADSLRRLDVGRVMCFPGGFSLEQAQELQAKLQDVVTASIKSLSTDQMREVVVTYMLTLIREVSAISETVSSTCDIALVDGSEVMLAMSVWAGDQALTFAPMLNHVAG